MSFIHGFLVVCREYSTPHKGSPMNSENISGENFPAVSLASRYLRLCVTSAVRVVQLVASEASFRSPVRKSSDVFSN